MRKAELGNWLQEEYRQWEGFLDQIEPTRMDQPGVNGDWSMKDIVAHLTGWNRWLVARLQTAQRNEPEPPPPWPAHLQNEDALTISMMTMNQTYAPGWREIGSPAVDAGRDHATSPLCATIFQLRAVAQTQARFQVDVVAVAHQQGIRQVQHMLDLGRAEACRQIESCDEVASRWTTM